MKVLLDLATRSSIIVVAALAASALLRHRPAALRHWVLAAGVFFAAAVLPLRFVMPRWDLPLPAAAPAPRHAASPSAHAPATLPDEPAEAFEPASTLPSVTIVWGAGLAIAAGMLMAGLGRLAWITARAEHVRDGEWARLAEEVSATYGLRRRVVLLQTDRPEMLATWGLFRPSVLLPRHARQWSEDRARAVLYHELAHIRRCDWLVQMIAETLRTVYWFNPLLWMVCSQLRRESEKACDDAVLAAGVPAREYGAHLLDIAKSCRRSEPIWAPAILLARPSSLERRIANMLNPAINRGALTRRALIVTTVALLGVTLPISAFRAAAQNTPLTLSGSIYDTTGAVLPQVELKLEDAQQVSWQATTDGSGRFEFPTIAPGSYVLEASLPGFRPLRHEFALQQARDWEQAITLQVGAIDESVTVTARRPPATQPQSGARNVAPLRVGGNIRPPRKLFDVKPVYPPAMREAGLEGVVPIEAVIGRDGDVLSVRVLSAQIHPEFAMAAMDAVRQWRFDSTLLNGVSVEVTMTVSVRFSLTD